MSGSSNDAASEWESIAGPVLEDSPSVGSDFEDPFSDEQQGSAAIGEQRPTDLARETYPDFFARKRRVIRDIPSLEAIATRRGLPPRYLEWVVPCAINCLPCGAVVAEAGDALLCVPEEVPPLDFGRLIELLESFNALEQLRNLKPSQDLWAPCPRCHLPFRARWPQGPDGRLSLKEAYFAPPPENGSRGFELGFSAEIDQSSPSGLVLSLTNRGVRTNAVESADVTEKDGDPDMGLYIYVSPVVQKAIAKGQGILDLKPILGYRELLNREKESGKGWAVAGIRFSLDPGEFPGVLRSPTLE